jgi:signal recognition particle subunit SRP54
MMREIRDVQTLLEPAETLFVVDAMAGQDAVNSAKAFAEALPLTGVVLTKADGDARGGVALSVREVTGIPIKLVGTGEKPDGLEDFDPARFASRILGMGDIVGLVAQVQAGVDQAAAEKMASKVRRGKELNLEDFREQLEQISKMGGLESLLDKLPGLPKGLEMQPQFDPRTIRRQIALITSMTRQERLRPDIIDGSRKRRISAGAGQSIQDLNRLLKQHRMLAKTMKQVGKGGLAGMQRMLGGAARTLQARGPGPRRR